MLHSISWKQFMLFIAWAAVIYYLWVVVRFYRQDIAALLTGKRMEKDNTPNGDQGENHNDNKNKNI